jgi:Zn-finger protein
MKHTLRLYYCAFCYAQTFICSNCDRGQIYCSSTCSSVARKKSCKEANQRYQKTIKGRVTNALRQKRFRRRLKNLVTDQGTHFTPQNALLHEDDNKPKKSVIE